MRKQGEITVFLSLILICVMSLFFGLVESARTAGARLYLEMASNSAMASVMSQYNRNLWNMYHLLFLEAESDQAVEQSFASYLGFYLDQENLYPMEMNEVKMLGKTTMTEDGGKALEQEILSYVGYRLPDVAADLAGIARVAKEAETAGDFKYLFEVCRTAGIKTRKLEACRKKVERLLLEMREMKGRLEDAVYKEDTGQFESQAEMLIREIRKFPDWTADYEKEVQKVSEQVADLKKDQKAAVADSAANENLVREISAYEQVSAAAKKRLGEYREMGTVLENNRKYLSEALEVRNNRKPAGADETINKDSGPDWGLVQEYLDLVIIPEGAVYGSADAEKVSALDRLEELFHGDLLELLLPANVDVSKRTVRIKDVSSKEEGMSSAEYSGRATAEQFLINEYCFLSFDSFLEKCTRKQQPGDQQLLYEQEYLLCGREADRENLKGTVERLLTLRGAMNLLYLLGSPEKKTEADSLAAAVSGGNAPVQFILSFFILTMWAFGEAIWDVKCLLAGGTVSFWKSHDSWKLEIEELLALRFLEPAGNEKKEGRGGDYRDYMRIMFLLMDKEERNFRMMDVIQWNVRSVQKDFLAADCITDVKITVEIKERHLFLLQTEYLRTAETVGTY